MTPEQKAAYIHAQSTAAFVDALGMMSENMQREATGKSMAYEHQAFLDLINEYGIHHNAVIEFFRD